jgi:hypothetical protein
MPPGLVRGVVTFSSAQAWCHAVGLPLNSNVRLHKPLPFSVRQAITYSLNL